MNTKYAIVTGASSGIGRELAIIAARDGYDLLLAADTAGLAQVADLCRGSGSTVETLEVDLATEDGVDQLYAATQGRAVDALFANAGHGLGRGFLEQEFDEVRHVIDTNITGTIYLVQQVARDMVELGSGRILITGSIAGYMPGSFQAVYNGTKAFIDSFSFALRNELKDSGVTFTCLMPGATDSEFFERADMLDTKVGADDKDDPADVARDGFEALMNGDERVVSASMKTKLQARASRLLPDKVKSAMHGDMAEPGGAKD